jgi:hypothetical protein
MIAGLARFENNVWTTYTLGNSALTDLKIRDVTIDQTGKVWAVSEVGGISIFDKNVIVSTNDIFDDKKDFNFKNIHLSPNPVVDVLTINVAAEIVSSVIIYDISGNIIKELQTFESNKNNKGLTINISDLKAGLYFIQIITPSAKVTKSFIKM